jgi:hypothetical protein
MPVKTALGDVMRDTDRHHSRQPSHPERSAW